MSNITIAIAGVTLPDPTSLLEVTEPNETDVRTLDGTLYTDFVNRLRSWEVKWQRMSKTDYDALRVVYDDQYSSGIYHLLQIPYYNVETLVKISISKKDIKFDGSCINNFSITLQEQTAVS